MPPQIPTRHYLSANQCTGFYISIIMGDRVKEKKEANWGNKKISIIDWFDIWYSVTWKKSNLGRFTQDIHIYNGQYKVCIFNLYLEI